MSRRKKKGLALLLACCMMFGLSSPVLAAGLAEQPLRIAAVSDLYLSEGGVENRKGLLLSKSGELLDQAIQSILNSSAEVVLVTGNLTYDGSMASHRYTASRLHQLLEAGKQVYVIPGENDIARAGINPDAVRDADFVNVYQDFGYNQALNRSGLSYVVQPRGEYRLLMLDSCGDGVTGTGGVDAAWAEAQVDTAFRQGAKMAGASHFPSISRGSFERGLMDWLFKLASVRDENGNLLFTGDPMEGLALTDRSAFPAQEMQTLADAGLQTLVTGHAHLMDTEQGGTPESPWTEYGVGALASASAGVRYLTVSPDGTVESTVERITNAGERPVIPEALAAIRAYMPEYVDECDAMFRPALIRALEITKVIAGKSIDAWKLPENYPAFLHNALKAAAKNAVGTALSGLLSSANLYPALDELKAAFLSTQVYGEPMFSLLGGSIFARQSGQSPFGPALQLLLYELRRGDGKALGKLLELVAPNLNRDMDSLLALINSVLDNKLSIVMVQHSFRELLSGPVTYALLKMDFWEMLDGEFAVRPDGSQTPAEELPGAVYRPLVNDILLMDNDPGTMPLTADRFCSGLLANSQQIGERVLAPMVAAYS